MELLPRRVHGLEPPVAVQARDVVTRHGRVRLYERGSGPTVVLAHSFNAAGTGWELRSLFDHLCRSRRAVLFDWLGFGTSERPDVPYGPDLYMDVLRDTLSHVGGEPADVVVVSLPSQYVVRLAVLEPSRFRTLSLISPTGVGRFGGRGPTAVGRATFGLLRTPVVGPALFRALGSRPSIEFFLRRLFADPSRIPADYRDACVATVRAPGALFAPARFVAGMLDDPTAARNFGQLRTPTLAVFGDHPRFADPGAFRALARRRRSFRVEVVGDSGDLPQLERPDEAAGLIELFLAAA